MILFHSIMHVSYKTRHAEELIITRGGVFYNSSTLPPILFFLISPCVAKQFLKLKHQSVMWPNLYSHLMKNLHSQNKTVKPQCKRNSNFHTPKSHREHRSNSHKIVTLAQIKSHNEHSRNFHFISNVEKLGQPNYDPCIYHIATTVAWGRGIFT